MDQWDSPSQKPPFITPFLSLFFLLSSSKGFVLDRKYERLTSYVTLSLTWASIFSIMMNYDYYRVRDCQAGWQVRIYDSYPFQQQRNKRETLHMKKFRDSLSLAFSLTFSSTRLGSIVKRLASSSD